jgi:ABC-type lipoprotein release transport system permease subunit
MLYDVSPSDPITLSAVILLVAGVATLAAILPAVRASRIDPMQALREE